MFLWSPRGGGNVSFIKCLVLTLLALLMMPPLTAAFLGRGTLLEQQGDIFDIYCDDFDRNVRVWHHREITREAVRRAVVTYFKVRRKNSFSHRINNIILFLWLVQCKVTIGIGKSVKDAMLWE